MAFIDDRINTTQSLQSLTNANAGCAPGSYIRKPVRRNVRNFSETGPAKFFDAKKWRLCNEKSLATLALGATVSIGAVASPTTADARWHHGFPVAPIVGSLAAGAILGAALAAPRPYYDAYAYEPVYFGPRCYIRRERFWDGWRWHVHRVEDCY